MVARFIFTYAINGYLHYKSLSFTSIYIVRYTWYNIMSYSLLVTCKRFVVFYRYFGWMYPNLSKGFHSVQPDMTRAFSFTSFITKYFVQVHFDYKEASVQTSWYMYNGFSLSSSRLKKILINRVAVVALIIW